MNKNIWVGVYAVSFLLFFLTLIVVGLILLVQVDQVYQFSPNVLIGLIAFGVLAYLQFILVQTIYGFLLLGKMWGSIQDGVTPVSVGKAIGFLFIPFFSVYWIFVAWGGFPKHYNEYIDRYKLNAPYLSNGIYTALPILILLTGLLLFPLVALPIVFAFVIARTCDAINNLKQATDDRQNGIVQPSRQQAQMQTPKSKLIPAAIGGLVIASVLFFTAFGVFAVRNLNPAKNDGVLPETVGKFKKDYSYANGSIFGLRSEYSARYKPDAALKTSEGIDYRMIDYSREADAISRLKDSSYCSSGAAKKEGAIKDKSGSQIGDFIICGDRFYFRTKKKFISLSNSYTSISGDEMIQFFTGLPYNAEVDTADITAAVKSLPSPPVPTLSNTKTDNSKAAVAVGDKADFTLTAEEFYKESDGANGTKNKEKYAGKIIEIAGRFYSIYGSETVSLHAGKNTVSLKVAAESQTNIGKLKKDERATFKCRGDASYRPELINCVITGTKGVMSPDETPDYTFTAKDYFSQVDGNQSYDSKSKKQELYAGKIVELSGKVKVIGSKRQYLTIEEYKWINCEPDEENAAQFSNLSEGQEVKFKGLGSRYGASLEHCIVVSQ